jgi:hypothetical protein
MKRIEAGPISGGQVYAVIERVFSHLLAAEKADADHCLRQRLRLIWQRALFVRAELLRDVVVFSLLSDEELHQISASTGLALNVASMKAVASSLEPKQSTHCAADRPARGTVSKKMIPIPSDL